jgi:hypothetical protein
MYKTLHVVLIKFSVGEFYTGTIYILIVLTGYNIWNQGILLNVWICATGQQQIPSC